jgi:hypothetical protein
MLEIRAITIQSEVTVLFGTGSSGGRSGRAQIRLTHARERKEMEFHSEAACVQQGLTPISSRRVVKDLGIQVAHTW